jgi:hypothetical protein
MIDEKDANFLTLPLLFEGRYPKRGESLHLEKMRHTATVLKSYLREEAS